MKEQWKELSNGDKKLVVVLSIAWALISVFAIMSWGIAVGGIITASIAVPAMYIYFGLGGSGDMVLNGSGDMLLIGIALLAVIVVVMAKLTDCQNNLRTEYTANVINGSKIETVEATGCCISRGNKTCVIDGEKVQVIQYEKK